MHIYLIPGYGVPKNILLDNNYHCYLSVVFNTIYSDSVTNKKEKMLIIFAGGNSDLFKPYRRTESAEMMRFFKTIATRPACRIQTKKWKFINERRSLSTLENLVFARRLLKARPMPIKSVSIFCEFTRAQRIRLLASKVFVGTKILVRPIDFDMSINRYLDPAIVDQREKAVARVEFWALKRPENLKKYRRALIDRIRFLRQLKPKQDSKTVRIWWERRLGQLS